MLYQVGTLLNINGLDGKVIGYIEYSNPQDGNKTWFEYRLKTNRGERWLSCDEAYNEYSISWPANDIRGQIGPEWHKVDEGTEVVRRFAGDVDVDQGEMARFVEYEDASEDHILSLEMWSDGSEFSRGEYIEKSDIVVTGFEEPPRIHIKKGTGFLYGAIVVLFLFGNMIIGGLTSIFYHAQTIEKYVSNSASYTYETSITGNENQKADVYVYSTMSTTDDVAKDIIDGIEGYTQSVTQKDDTFDQEIAIVTKKEYCLVYHPENEPTTVYVQVSNRKYNYTSDNSLYRSSNSCNTWYRAHYYSSSYSADSSSFRSTPSAYSMYSGSTVHNIGNGYFDTYASSVKQASINSRKSSSGGLSSGK